MPEAISELLNKVDRVLSSKQYSGATLRKSVDLHIFMTLREISCHTGRCDKIVTRSESKLGLPKLGGGWGQDKVHRVNSDMEWVSLLSDRAACFINLKDSELVLS